MKTKTGRDWRRRTSVIGVFDLFSGQIILCCARFEVWKFYQKPSNDKIIILLIMNAGRIGRIYQTLNFQGGQIQRLFVLYNKRALVYLFLGFKWY